MNAAIQGAIVGDNAVRRKSASTSPTLPTSSQLGPSPSTASALSGATAQTSGFAQAGSDSHSFGNPVQPPSGGVDPLDTGRRASAGQYGGIGGLNGGLVGGFGGGYLPVTGGLQTSPNVPKPGTSIDPATGKPHTAGLTRAELEAKKAAAAEGLTAGTLTGNATDHRPVSDLTGREQAARQLAGGVQSDVMTPGKELPGGWGPAKQVSLPGSGKPDAVASVYEDIAEGLEKVGHAAFGLIPQGLKDALNPDLPLDKGKQPMGSPAKPRKSSVGVFLDNAKQQGEKVLHEVQDTIQSHRRTSTGGTETSVLSQVKNFFAEAGQAADAKVHGQAGPMAATIGLATGAGALGATGTTGLAAPKKSLPSDEPAGALPGEHSSGVGALPGLASETGVAVLPDEKKVAPVSSTSTEVPKAAGENALVAQTQPSHENQGMLPGEVSAGVGALPGSSKEEGVALLPDEKAATGTEGGLVLTGDKETSAAGTSAATTSALAAGGSHGLAPPLPATVLGDGAAKGATDLEEAGLPSSSSTVITPGSSTTDGTSSLNPASAALDRGVNDRTTSNASITAIRHGHEGQRSSPLAETVTHEDAPIISGPEATSADEAAALKASKDETTPGVSGATSLTPGKETDGVGHPSSRGEGTSREPGTYPKPDHDGPAHELKDVTATGTSTSTNHNGAPSTADNAKTTSAAAIPASPKSPITAQNSSLADETSGHRRTSSGGSNGKKKVGFMNKLKGEIKVIGGKIQHNEAKIQEGEKLKHGEL